MSKGTRKKSSATSLDAREVGQFDALADRWWDEEGPFRPLHRLNPVRLGYIRDQACRHFGLDAESFTPLKGMTALDIGCGGGIVTEPLCRMGAKTTGLDAGAENIAAARAHAAQSGLKIDYLCTTAEKLAASGKKFDLVVALEIVEHVADVELFLDACAKLVKKDGLLILSTLNRTAKSYALGIVAAEYILRWVPMGTHDWRKFLKPSEIAASLPGMEVTDVTGMTYDPFAGTFALNKKDLAVNYLLTARRAR